MDFLIHTDRLSIQPFLLLNITEEYLLWMNDKKNLAFSEQRHLTHTYDSAKKYLDSFRDSNNLFLSISETSNDSRHIGNMSVYVDSNNEIADLTIMIGKRDAQRQGYASEAWVAVCKYLFNYMNIRKITAGTLSVNYPMIRLMKKTGMNEDGKRSMHYKVGDNYADLLYMSIFRD